MDNRIKEYEILNFREIVKFNKKSTTQGDIILDEGDMLESFLTEIQFKQMDYEIRCELFEQEIESELTIMCEILSKWSAEHNIYFPEKQILIKGMIQWCTNITSSISKDGENENAE